MKKAFIVLMLVLPLGTAFAQNPILVSLGANYMHPLDSGYREIYGKHAFYPDFTLGLRLYRGLYFLGSFGLLANRGITPELSLPAQSRQNFLSLGLGYIMKISGILNLEVESGALMAFYKEEALETAVSGKQSGFKVEIGFLLKNEDANIFVGLKAGYLMANVRELGIKLGGIKAGLCIGFH